AGVGRTLERLGPVSHAYALAVVMGGWVLFRSSTLARAGIFYSACSDWGLAIRFSVRSLNFSIRWWPRRSLSPWQARRRLRGIWASGWNTSPAHVPVPASSS